MTEERFNAGNFSARVLRCNTAIVGTGAAGYNAADRLWQYGRQDILLITEKRTAGTSRNTGSDKQTYYKLTLSGGDPFMQPVPCLALAEGAHKLGLNVWTYTGYTWEALWEENDAEKLALLKETDVLVDGPFLLAERSLELQFCGSRNQRLIDVKKSLAADKVVLWEEPSYF